MTAIDITDGRTVYPIEAGTSVDIGRAVARLHHIHWQMVTDQLREGLPVEPWPIASNQSLWSALLDAERDRMQRQPRGRR